MKTEKTEREREKLKKSRTRKASLESVRIFET